MKVLHWSSLIQLCLVFDWRWEFLLCFLLQLRCFGVAGMQFWKDFLHGKERSKSKKTPPGNSWTWKMANTFTLKIHCHDARKTFRITLTLKTSIQHTLHPTARGVPLPVLLCIWQLWFSRLHQVFFVWANAEEHGPWLWQMKNIFPGNVKGNTFLQMAETSSSRCAICKPWRHAPTLLWHAWRTNLHPTKAIVSIRIQGLDLSERARESDMSNSQNQRCTHLTKTKVTKISYDNIHISSRERERQRGGRAHGCVYVFGHFCKQKCLLNSSQNVCLAA